jgi:hypothetical protein
VNLSGQAQGLFGLLGIKDGGRGPGFAPDEVQLGVDLTPLYLLNFRELIQIPNQAAVIGTNTMGAAYTVPTGEVWFVHAHGVSTNVLPAAPSIRVRTAIIPQSQGVIATGEAGSSALAGDIVRVYANAQMWLTSGDQLAATVETLAAAVQLSSSAYITRLRV